MASRTPRNGLAAAFAPGELTQAINPWSWWRNSMQQLGFINVYQMESSDGDKEIEIVEEVASYGKQLGRVVEALEVLVARTEDRDLRDDEKRALEGFSEMAAEIAAVKGRHLAPTGDNLDLFLAGLRRMEQQDPRAYAKARERLREELFPDR